MCVLCAASARTVFHNEQTNSVSSQNSDIIDEGLRNAECHKTNSGKKSSSAPIQGMCPPMQRQDQFCRFCIRRFLLIGIREMGYKRR